MNWDKMIERMKDRIERYKSAPIETEYITAAALCSIAKSLGDDSFDGVDEHIRILKEKNKKLEYALDSLREQHLLRPHDISDIQAAIIKRQVVLIDMIADRLVNIHTETITEHYEERDRRVINEILPAIEKERKL